MKRYDEFRSSLSVLARAEEQDLSNEFIQSGIVEKFSLQFELGWKTLKDLLRYEGDATWSTGSPRDIVKSAYRLFDFIDEETWLAMLQDRNAILHTYNEEALVKLVMTIIESYIPAFRAMEQGILASYGETLKLIP